MMSSGEKPMKLGQCPIQSPEKDHGTSRKRMEKIGLIEKTQVFNNSSFRWVILGHRPGTVQSLFIPPSDLGVSAVNNPGPCICIYSCPLVSLRGRFSEFGG